MAFLNTPQVSLICKEIRLGIVCDIAHSTNFRILFCILCAWLFLKWILKLLRPGIFVIPYNCIERYNLRLFFFGVWSFSIFFFFFYCTSFNFSPHLSNLILIWISKSVWSSLERSLKSFIYDENSFAIVYRNSSWLIFLFISEGWHNRVDHVLIDESRHSSMIDARS